MDQTAHAPAGTPGGPVSDSRTAGHQQRIADEMGLCREYCGLLGYCLAAANNWTCPVIELTRSEL